MTRPLAVALALVSVVLALPACGGSSKPAYCAQKTALQNSLKQLTSSSTLSGGVTSITGAVQKVETDAQALVSAVKTEFAPQTTALTSSLSALETSVGQLSSSQTRAAALAALPAQVSAFETAVQNLADAAKNRCG